MIKQGREIEDQGKRDAVLIRGKKDSLIRCYFIRRYMDIYKSS